ncbi:MAG: PmoA family protein [Chitinophagaceae bacterium]
MKYIIILILTAGLFFHASAQKWQKVQIVQDKKDKKLDVMIGGKYFTTFLYPDSLEKPVLYPLTAANGTIVTRGFPLNPLPGEPTDHPHHLGLWFNYENVNGLDFWNNSFAIPAEKKKMYGWIKTDEIVGITAKSMGDFQSGGFTFHARWTNQANETLLTEQTTYTFSGNDHQRFIDRETILTAVKDVSFNDAKDGMLGLRLAHELQIPAMKDQKFTDDKGNVTTVKASADNIANGNYITSEGKQGDSAWSTRAAWCKVYGKMKNDSISIAIIDRPSNPNYPTFWHARGYGLFAANPLGEKIFTNGKSEKNMKLKPGEKVRFVYRIIIDNGAATISSEELNKQAVQFAKEKAQK